MSVRHLSEGTWVSEAHIGIALALSLDQLLSQSLLSGVCLPTELDCLSPMSLNAIHLQDISVDEAEVRSKYEAGALAKVRTPISI